MDLLEDFNKNIPEAAEILSSEDEKALGEGDGGMGHQLADRHVMSDLRLKEITKKLICDGCDSF